MLRDQRQAEPASPVGVIAVIVLLAVIVLGVGGGLPRLLNKNDSNQGSVGLLTPIAPGTELPQPTATTTEASGSMSTDFTPPLQTERPGAAATASADQIADSWAKLFYARSPTTETYQQLVERAAQFTTSELATSFASAGDGTYDALAAAGGASKVVSVSVAAPRPDTAPVDTPTRITRLVTVTIDTTGKGARRFTLPLLVTVIPQDGRWVISAVNGGTGP